MMPQALEENFSPKELARAIDSLKNNKILGLGGLPAEFFKVFKDTLVPLLLIWKESLTHKELPCSINTGVS